MDKETVRQRNNDRKHDKEIVWQGNGDCSVTYDKEIDDKEMVDNNKKCDSMAIVTLSHTKWCYVKETKR